MHMCVEIGDQLQAPFSLTFPESAAHRYFSRLANKTRSLCLHLPNNTDVTDAHSFNHLDSLYGTCATLWETLKKKKLKKKIKNTATKLQGYNYINHILKLYICILWVLTIWTTLICTPRNYNTLTWNFHLRVNHLGMQLTNYRFSKKGTFFGECG